MDVPIVGLQGVRDVTNTLTTLPGYTRALFIDAVLHSVHSSHDAFASKFGFPAFFKMNDSDSDSAGSTALDQQLMELRQFTLETAVDRLFPLDRPHECWRLRTRPPSPLG